ncbi:MAG: hypothetical protein ACXV5Q_17085 [Frankiaceae bacterium]
MAPACRPAPTRLSASGQNGALSAGESTGTLPDILLVFQDGSCWAVDAQSSIGRALRALADVLALRPRSPGRPSAARAGSGAR